MASVKVGRSRVFVSPGSSPGDSAIFIKCCLCAVSDLFRVNLRSVYRYSTVTYEALVKLGFENLCKASSFVGKQEHFFETKMVRRRQN